MPTVVVRCEVQKYLYWKVFIKLTMLWRQAQLQPNCSICTNVGQTCILKLNIDIVCQVQIIIVSVLMTYVNVIIKRDDDQFDVELDQRHALEDSEHSKMTMLSYVCVIVFASDLQSGHLAN